MRIKCLIENNRAVVVIQPSTLPTYGFLRAHPSHSLSKEILWLLPYLVRCAFDNL